MVQRDKTVYIQIAVSVLPIVLTLATGFISITNNITMLTTKVGEMKEELKTSQISIQKDLAVRDGRLDRIEARIDTLTQKAYAGQMNNAKN